MLSSEDDIFWIYASLHGKTQKKAARNPKNPETARRLCRTSLSSRKGDKIPRTPKNARNAPNFDYLDPGHINPHPAYKSPKFGLFCHKNGKYHVIQTPHIHQELFFKPKTPQNPAKKNKEHHLDDAPITRPPPGRRANMYKPKPSAKIPINTTPRTKTPRKPLSPKIYNKKNFRKIYPKR